MNVEVIRARAAYHKRNARGTFAASDEHSGNLFDLAANEIESLTAERDRLRKALELAANRLYEEGAPHSYVDDAREVLAGRDPY